MLSPCNDLHTIQTELEIVTEAIQSIEQLAEQCKYSDENSAGLISRALVPLCLELECIVNKISKIQDLNEVSVSEFVRSRRESPSMSRIVTGMQSIRKILAK